MDRRGDGQTISNFNLEHLSEIAAMQGKTFALAGHIKNPGARPGAFLQKTYVQFGLDSHQHRHWFDHPELVKFFDAELHNEKLAA